MPEENYLLEPNPEIRNFGELFGHVANAQFSACAAAVVVARSLELGRRMSYLPVELRLGVEHSG